VNKDQTDALSAVAELGRSVSTQELHLLRTKRDRDVAIRHALSLGVAATRIASAAHLTRDMIYKLARRRSA